MAVIVGSVGIACAGWPERAVAFCRWYHRKKLHSIQELPLADVVMRPWMPTYFRCMGTLFCLIAIGLIWIATTKG